MNLKQSRAFQTLGCLSRPSIVSLVFTCCACTYAVPQDAPPLPRFESVAVVSKGATSDLKARFGVTPDNSSTGAGAGAGAGTGALVAVGVSMACGPFALLCALATVPAGAMVGAVGGSLAGKAVDTQKKPPEEQLLILDNLFVELAQHRTIHQEIRDALVRQIPTDRLEDAASAYALLQLSLHDVRFTQNSSGEYVLNLKAVMLAQWNRNMRQIRNGRRTYRESSRPLPMEDWIQDEGKTLNLAFDACVEGLSEQMVEDIQFEVL